MESPCNTLDQLQTVKDAELTPDAIKIDNEQESHKHEHESRYRFIRFPDIHPPKERTSYYIPANPVFIHGACPYVLSPGFLDRVLGLPLELQENIFEQIIEDTPQASPQRTVTDRTSPNGCHVGLARRNTPASAKKELGALEKINIDSERIFSAYKGGMFNYLSAKSIHSMSVVSGILQETGKTDPKALKMFEHFRAYVGKTTVLDLKTESFFRDGALYWLKNHDFYHSNIQHITLNRVPAQDGLFMHQWELVWLCTYIKQTFKNLKTVVLWLTMTDLEVVEAEESSIDAKWITAIRNLPVKESFELKIHVVREERGCKHILSKESETRDYDKITKLVTPMSLQTDKLLV